MRLAAAIGLVLAAATPGGAAEPPGAGACPVGDYTYEITRKGERKGVRRVEVARAGGACRVRTTQWLEDTSYCHRLEREERWRGGSLERYASTAVGWCGVAARLFEPESCRWDAGGAPRIVRARHADGATVLEAGGERRVLRDPVATMTFQGPLFPGVEGRIVLIEPVFGAPNPAEVTRLPGTDGAGVRLRLRGESMSERTLVYDRQGWLREVRIHSGGAAGERAVRRLAPGGDVAPPAPRQRACEPVLRPAS